MIVIIDYGMGNLRSVSKALETVGARVEVTNSLKTVAKAKAIVLPGVGAFARGMENLNKLNVIPVIFSAIEKNIPLLGICLGLQLLFTESQEHGTHKGLNIIKGKIRKFPGNINIKIPHMGWNQVRIKKPDPKPELFKGIPDNSYFYFVHSYYVQPEDKGVILATTEYGVEFSSAVSKGNIFGLQFHPEKSGEFGLGILRNFYLKLC